MRNLILFIILLMFLLKTTQAQELRAIWLSNQQCTSKEKLQGVIKKAAENGINTINMVVWYQGYPLYKSNVFYAATGGSSTGEYMHPHAYYKDHDYLKAAIAAAHAYGMHLVAWFEFGFSFGVTANTSSGEPAYKPLLVKNPTWALSTSAYETNFYWANPNNSGVQKLLKDMAVEVATNYDVDGIQFDRTRYPVGYHAAYNQTYATYINNFLKSLRDAVKTVNPNVLVSNAPSQYSTAYGDGKCIDYKWWKTNNAVDQLIVQAYSGDLSSYSSRLTTIKGFVGTSGVYPAQAIKVSGTIVGNFSTYVNANINAGFSGISYWYYGDIDVNSLWSSVNSTYSTRKYAPQPTVSSALAKEWRTVKVVVPHTDAVKTGTWKTSGSKSWDLTTAGIYTAENTATIDYNANVLKEGNYEVYMYLPTNASRTAVAKHTVFSQNSSTKANISTDVIINQTLKINLGWYKIGDFYFTPGTKKVLTVSAPNLETNMNLEADALVLSLNRRMSPDVLPVELTTFTGYSTGKGVELQWTTVTEINNSGFEVERSKSKESINWEKIGEVAGAGNSNSIKNYTFTDNDAKMGKYLYRLKQIDNDGKYEYSKEIEVDLGKPAEFTLLQNYPNPFNPTTTISYTITGSNGGLIPVQLKVYDMLGKEVAVLVNEMQKAGVYNVNFNASELSSGLYMYKIEAGNYRKTMKMMLVK